MRSRANNEIIYLIIYYFPFIDEFITMICVSYDVSVGAQHVLYAGGGQPAGAAHY